MTSPGVLQDESNRPSQQRPQALSIPKNRSFVNSASQPSSSASLATDASQPKRGFSVDGGRTEEAYDSLSISPILSPNPESGLRRIRQHPLPPPQRKFSSPNLQPLAPAHSPAASNPPSRKSSLPHIAGPATPGLPFSEDLTRFPSESLHSFSFAHQSADSLHNRQNVLKRSINFMRDRVSWAATSPRIARAQAQLAGDEELLSMMELLQKANMVGSQGLNATAVGLGIDKGPLTGPAHPANVNVFEQSFLSPRDPLVPGPLSPVSPTTITEEPEEAENANERKLSEVSVGILNPDGERELPDLERSTTITSTDSALDSLPPQRPQRASLKRTYTDVAGYSLQHKLSEAMAQPYHMNEPSSAVPVTNPPTFRPLPPKRSGTTINERAPHGHRNNQAQAIFTTEAKAPWTITAANDLACLVFGVTRAEVRKLGIMEVIKEERRKWLEDRLQNPGSEATVRQDKQSPPHQPSTQAGKKTPSPAVSTMGRGITAKLLSKPPSRQTYQSRRSKTEGGPAPRSGNAAGGTANSDNNASKSRGVLLCGDVIPIQKMNGSTGSASLWVKEKGGGLIWVLEEIAEDVAFLTVDEIGSVLRGSGDVEAIWGLERVRNGMDVQRLIPAFPKLKGTNTGALDYDEVARLRRFTARTSNSISIPITVEQVEGESDNFRVSSFPHIAGIIVLNSATMKVSSSNSVFSSALFGYASPDGMPVTDLIPSFDTLLRVMTDEDKIALVDGIVIPEHSFRRARALLALREGSADAAAIFLRPSGLPARHRDGAEIMIDVQMRVVKSDRDPIYNETVVEEEGEAAGSEVVYALWITYSRQLHAVNHGVGPVTPMISRPGTPPQQPHPGSGTRHHVDSSIPTPVRNIGDASGGDGLRTALLKEQLEEVRSLKEQLEEVGSPQEGDGDSADLEPYEHPSADMAETGVTIIKKKRIDDFNILEEMGQGAYGQVKLARYKSTAAKKMVIKYVTKRRILVDTWHRDRRLGTVPLEIHVLDYLRRDGLQHPNIVEMADFFEDDINYYIEMVPHGLPGMDLFDYIELRVTMEEAECRKIFRQVAEALEHLHVKARVVHRDIKDENVILDGEGRVKLVDFGSAAYVKSGPFDVFVGTIDYAAPEVLRGSPYRGKEQDVWALGILLYTIVYKENPFYSIDEIMDHDLRVPYVMSDDCIDLIRRMLDRDVDRRIAIQAVLDHPWCTAVDDDDDEANADGDGGEEEDDGLMMTKKTAAVDVARV